MGESEGATSLPRPPHVCLCLENPILACLLSDGGHTCLWLGGSEPLFLKASMAT